MILRRTFFVLTRRRGNVVGHAPAWREMDAGASRLHFHAGAWEREEPFPHAERESLRVRWDKLKE